MKFAVARSKIVDYLLKDPAKSKFFLLFGYSAASWQQLQQDILALGAQNEASMRLRQETVYGKEYEISGEVLTPVGRKVLLTSAWYLDAGEVEMIRFITAYPA
jgi:hypothetical protein